MSEGIKFLQSITNQALSDTNTSLICRIEKYDPSVMKADVQPLNKYKGELLPLIQEVPCSTIKAGGFLIRPPYKKGDIVLVVFSQRSIDEVVYQGKEADAVSDRKLSLDDAIVVQGINTFSNQLPTVHENDLLIGTEDFTSKVVFNTNGEIIIEGAKIYLGENATDAMPLGNKLKSWLDSHEHDISDIKTWLDSHTHDISTIKSWLDNHVHYKDGQVSTETGKPTTSSPSETDASTSTSPTKSNSSTTVSPAPNEKVRI